MSHATVAYDAFAAASGNHQLSRRIGASASKRQLKAAAGSSDKNYEAVGSSQMNGV